MKKRKIKNRIIIAVLIVALILGIFFSPKLNIIGRAIKSDASQGKIVQVQLTKDNFHLFLQQQDIVKELPEKALISLKLYNFDSGERQWEKSYIITESSVSEGDAKNPDLEIILSSKYLFDVAKDLCSAVKKAKVNNDIGFDLKISMTSFLWKYKSMLGYKSCFGF